MMISTLLFVGVPIAIGYGILLLLRTVFPRKEKRLYEILVQRAGGDADLADRLIDFELRRSFDLARVQAIETAIWRLDRDRG